MAKNQLLAEAKKRIKENPDLPMEKAINSLKGMVFKGEVWKSFVYPNAPNSTHYEVSNLGRIRSRGHYTKRADRWGNILDYWYEGKVLAVRTNGKDDHLYVSLGRAFEGRIMSKTVYCHLAVAIAFVERPVGMDKATHKSEDKFDNRPENIKWVDQSYLSKKQMEKAPPERRNFIGKHQMAISINTDEMIADMISIVENGTKIYKAAELVGMNVSSAYYHYNKYKNEKT